MAYAFTPAAERAIAAAGQWRPDPARPVDAPEMLIGLLDEPECRAALILARYGVDAQAVQQRWPQLRFQTEESSDSHGFGPALLAALDFAEDRLFEHPRPLELATEHILLGLAGGGREVSAWLKQRGLNPDEIEAEVHRLAGHTPGPLNWDDDENAALRTAGLANRPNVVESKELEDQPHAIGN